MDIRYSANPSDFKHYTTAQIRNEFLIQDLYRADEMVAVYLHSDRMVTLGCMPVSGAVKLEQGIDVWGLFGTYYFLERREIGIFNVGDAGSITVDGTVYQMAHKDCLYITKGAKEVSFASDNGETPAKFYMVSTTAHCSYETTQIKYADASKNINGSPAISDERLTSMFLRAEVLKTCQLLMGMNELTTGNLWNTMPTHVHERRCEVYTYVDVKPGQPVFHMMGEPEETRHIVMQNEEAVVSPAWSIHAGVGTSNYTFIWAMGGENQDPTDSQACQGVALR